MNKIYAQMYSVREYCQEDLLATLTKIAQMGYTGVEFAGYYSVPARELKAHLDSLALTTLSSHVGIERLQDALEAEIEYLKVLGAKYIVCPYATIETEAQAIECAKILDAIGAKVKEHGLSLLYHNHAHELDITASRHPLDILFDTINSDHLQQQVDIYWLAHAGVDPIDYLTEHYARNPIVHLKQMENSTTKANVSASAGCINMAKVMALAPDAHYVYEQESSDNIMQAMAESVEYLKQLEV